MFQFTFTFTANELIHLCHLKKWMKDQYLWLFWWCCNCFLWQFILIFLEENLRYDNITSTQSLTCSIRHGFLFNFSFNRINWINLGYYFVWFLEAVHYLGGSENGNEKITLLIKITFGIPSNDVTYKFFSFSLRMSLFIPRTFAVFMPITLSE